MNDRMRFAVAPHVRLVATSRGVRVEPVEMPPGRDSAQRPTLARLVRAEKSVDASPGQLHTLERRLLSLHQTRPETGPRHVPAFRPVDVAALVARRQAAALEGISPLRRGARHAASVAAREAAELEAERTDERELAERERLVAEAEAEWALVERGDTEAVVASVERVFTEQAGEATCIDAGTGYVTVLLLVDSLATVPARIAGRTPGGVATLRRRTPVEQTTLVRNALGAQGMATVRLAAAWAAGASEIRLAVLRRETHGTGVHALGSAVFQRRDLATVRWETADPFSLLVDGDDAQFRRKGTTDELLPLASGAQPQLDDLAHRVGAVLSRTGAPAAR